MVLPDRIELSTSPLPMECSTTELRQRARYPKNRPQRGPYRRAVLATRTPLAQARGATGKSLNGQNRQGVVLPAANGSTSVPDCPVLHRPAPERRYHALGRREPEGIDDCAADGPNPICPDDRTSRDGTGNRPGMQDDQDKRTGKAGRDVRDSRHQRLKLALRENLKRRKSQARGRSDEAAASSETADASLDDAGGEKPGQ
jgi:hypothetical protein